MKNEQKAIMWPQDFAAIYKRKGYWVGETFGLMLKRWAAEFGDKAALVDMKTQWSFTTLNQKASQLAAGFHRIGLRAGDTAVVQLPNILEFYAVFFGLIRLGVKPVLALPAHRAVEIRSFCQHMDAKAYFCPDQTNGYDYPSLARSMLKECGQLAFAIVVGDSSDYIELNSLYDEEQDFPDAESGDVAFFLLSGGSTGIPKIIPRTHDDYIYSLRESAKICEVMRQDVYFCALPSAHNFALSSPGAMGCLHQGATVVLCQDPSPSAAFEFIEKTGATMTALTPPLVRLWLEAAPSEQLNSLRLLQVGGARLDQETALMVLDRLSCKLQQVFGMAEGLVCYTQPHDAIERIVAAEVLPITSDDEIKIVGTDEQDVSDGEVGDLLVRGPYTIRGYWGSAALNEVCFSEDGFYRTGDKVKKTQDGRLVVMGRSKDIVNRGGEIFATEDVEMHIRQHPAVIDAAIFAELDVRMGERSCAVIVLRTPVTAPEIRHYLRSQGLATFKIPDRIEFTHELAKTAVGKIDKNRLRALYAIKQGHE